MAHLSVYVNSVKPCSWHPDPRTDTLTSCIMNADGRHSQSSHRREAQWTSSAVEEHYMLLVVLPSWSLKTKKSVQQRSLMSGSKSPATINMVLFFLTEWQHFKERVRRDIVSRSRRSRRSSHIQEKAPISTYQNVHVHKQIVQQQIRASPKRLQQCCSGRFCMALAWCDWCLWFRDIANEL